MITVIGYDGRPLPEQALVAVGQADLVIGGARHLEAVRPSCETLVMGPVGPALERVSQAHAEGRNVVLLASGDPGFFGITRRLGALGVPFQVHPAVSSVATAFSRLGLPWDQALVVSAHGRPIGPAVAALLRFGFSRQPVAVLTDAASNPGRLVAALGSRCPELHVFERLGEDDEAYTRITREAQADAVTRAWREPNIVLAGGVGDLGDHPWVAGPSIGPATALPDESFSHRDGMLTKREVRASVLARLGPGVGTLVWDVGAGSGSVAVECSRWGAAVFAVEQDPGQLEHIAANAERHQAPVEVVHGKAPEALEGLPRPDAVFVGGGGPEVVAAVAAVRPERVVVALATLERVGPTVAALDGYDVETVLLQVQHVVPLGDGHRLAPANPVFVVSAVRS